MSRVKSAVLPLVLGLTLVIGAFAPAAAQTSATGDPGIQPGDVVQVTVWQRVELSGEYTVSPDGTLNHPLYRQVRVTGIPASQIEERLRSFLGEYEANPQIVVEPKYKVIVSGAVMRPEIYNLPPGTTVVQAVTRAGGVTENGERDDVKLIRNSREIELDLSQAEAIQMQLQSGDQIYVEPQGSGGFRQTVLPVLQMTLTVANLVAYFANR